MYYRAAHMLPLAILRLSAAIDIMSAIRYFQPGTRTYHLRFYQALAVSYAAVIKDHLWWSPSTHAQLISFSRQKIRVFLFPMMKKPYSFGWCRVHPASDDYSHIAGIAKWVIQLLIAIDDQSLPSPVVHLHIAGIRSGIRFGEPQALIHSAVASLGRYFFFCSSFPNCSILDQYRELWAATEETSGT